jgi:2-oxoisovalerate dehydrogenase E1 component
LLCAAIEDPNPYLFFEHKLMYRSLKGMIPDDYYTIPVGRAAMLTSGTDLTIVTYGMGVHWVLDSLKSFPQVKAEVIDLRTLLPWDQETVAASIKKTHRMLIVHEDTLTGGIGAEISAWVNEHCFEFLDAPVRRVASLDTAVPFAPTLEKNFLPAGRIENAIREILRY